MKIGDTGQKSTKSFLVGETLEGNLKYKKCVKILNAEV
jgi:hypothetical protein